jgi:RpiB/LacA/LacB family sugar-phosphate isomerase
MIFITSDHGGFKKKAALTAWLKKSGYPVIDIGPDKLDRQDDYPIWAARLARQVQNSPQAKGIAICRSGVGMAMAANKFSDIRAVQATTAVIAKKSRQDEDANILSLAADFTELDNMKKIVKIWLATKPATAGRHRRRLKEISRIEKHVG